MIYINNAKISEHENRTLAEWTFIIWGAWHGFFIIIEKIFNIKKFDEKKHNILINVLRHLYCILVFVIGWVIFRAENAEYSLKYIMNMFGFLHLHTNEFLYTFTYYAGRLEIIIFMAATMCCTPLFNNMIYSRNKIIKGFVNIWLLLLFCLSTITIASNTCNPFIYFRF